MTSTAWDRQRVGPWKNWRNIFHFSVTGPRSLWFLFPNLIWGLWILRPLNSHIRLSNQVFVCQHWKTSKKISGHRGMDLKVGIFFSFFLVFLFFFFIFSTVSLFAFHYAFLHFWTHWNSLVPTYFLYFWPECTLFILKQIHSHEVLSLALFWKCGLFEPRNSLRHKSLCTTISHIYKPRI